MNCFVYSTGQLSETYWTLLMVWCVFCAGSSGTISLNYVGRRHQGILTFLKTLRPELKERHFADIFKCILLENVCILYKILFKFDSEGSMDNK